MVRWRFGLATPSRGWISPQDPWFDPSMPTYNYDPEKAKQLLKQAGYPDGFELNVDIATQPLRVETAEAMQAQLAKVGVKMKLKPSEIGALITIWSAGNYEASLAWSGGTEDIDKFLANYRRSDPRSKALGCATPEMQDLIDKGAATMDQNERKKIYQQLDRAIYDIASDVFLLHAANNVALTKKVHDYKIALPVMFYFNDVWMDK